MRLEMHAHDCEVSPCAVIKAKELVDGYKEAGYDGIVITNHFDKGIMHLWGETTGGLSGIRRDKGFYPGAYGHLWLQSAGII